MHAFHCLSVLYNVIVNLLKSVEDVSGDKDRYGAHVYMYMYTEWWSRLTYSDYSSSSLL